MVRSESSSRGGTRSRTRWCTSRSTERTEEALEKFYAEVFGWHVQSLLEIGYATIDTHAGRGINGGIGTARQDPFVTLYVETPDVDATLVKAELLGAKTVVPVSDEGVARFALFTDPQGNVMGIVAQSEGPGDSEGIGVAVDWFEVLGPDASALKAFYSELYGWDLHGEEGAEWVLPPGQPSRSRHRRRRRSITGRAAARHAVRDGR